MPATARLSRQNGCLVPEHSAVLMQAMSGGEPLEIGNYRFYHARDWLMAIGYPLADRFSTAAFLEALKQAEEEIKPAAVFAIAPELPRELHANIIESDRYYVLSAEAPVPKRLRNPVSAAKKALEIREGTEFTAGHRRLWAEFLQMAGNGMNERVAELYAAAPKAIGKAGGQLRFLDAVDKNGNIAATLLLDFGPENFVAYILGAHSRVNYVPHAADLLFAEMLAAARRNGRPFVHLGLGVNDGILRFKKKWGAVPSWPFLMAQWEGSRERDMEEPAGRILANAILHSTGISARQYLRNEPGLRPFAMLWQIRKKGRVSWLAGTAHFFLHSFETSFRHLFRHVDNVIFEGPLDPTFMEQVSRAGRQLPEGARPLLDALTDTEIARLEKTVNGTGAMARLLGQGTGRTDVRWLLNHAMPWYAFFTLWTAFLERQGWRQSVDMEAWRIAHELGKNVIAMENLEEQLESLGSLPHERALNFFRSCQSWKKRARHNRQAYLAGDLEKMMGSSAEFPTRTEHIVSRRDQRFRERMRPWLEAGGAAVFVGSAHLVNLRHMLIEDGFTVTQQPYGIWPKLHLFWRRLSRPDVAW